MVDACVYTWAFSLLRLGRLAMPLTLTGMPTSCVCISVLSSTYKCNFLGADNKQ